MTEIIERKNRQKIQITKKNFNFYIFLEKKLLVFCTVEGTEQILKRFKFEFSTNLYNKKSLKFDYVILTCPEV